VVSDLHALTVQNYRRTLIFVVDGKRSDQLDGTATGDGSEEEASRKTIIQGRIDEQ
jgi:hypothetical protein